jgi:hypothetical protein
MNGPYTSFRMILQPRAVERRMIPHNIRHAQYPVMRMSNGEHVLHELILFILAHFGTSVKQVRRETELVVDGVRGIRTAASIDGRKMNHVVSTLGKAFEKVGPGGQGGHPFRDDRKDADAVKGQEGGRLRYEDFAR